MYSDEKNSAWSKKNATLSDKSARKEFGLSQEKIMEAIKAGKLQYRINNVFGNPYFRLLRSEVEALVKKNYGSSYLKKKKLQKELAQVNKELKMLKTQIVELERRRAELIESLDK
jgi:hypothetical protein